MGLFAGAQPPETLQTRAETSLSGVRRDQENEGEKRRTDHSHMDRTWHHRQIYRNQRSPSSLEKKWGEDRKRRKHNSFVPVYRPHGHRAEL